MVPFFFIYDSKVSIKAAHRRTKSHTGNIKHIRELSQNSRKFNSERSSDKTCAVISLKIKSNIRERAWKKRRGAIKKNESRDNKFLQLIFRPLLCVYISYQVASRARTWSRYRLTMSQAPVGLLKKYTALSTTYCHIARCRLCHWAVLLYYTNDMHTAVRIWTNIVRDFPVDSSFSFFFVLSLFV